MSNRFPIALRSLCWICLLAPILAAGAGGDQDKTVRVVYLVSGDRQVRTNYLQALEKAIRELQGWYARQLQGPTFKLHQPVVEVARSGQQASWFSSHPDGSNRDDWGFNNTLAEAGRLLGARYGDPHYIWVVYSDGPGDKGRGGSGVACLPENDLLGLIGLHPTQKDPARWVGGLGHELGHAFGLPHPADTQRDGDALMWAGFYGKYPAPTYLTESDKKTLLRSPFFFTPDGKPVANEETFTEEFRYEGGYFRKLATAGPPRWKEGKTASTDCFYFQELKRERGTIWLQDASRGLLLQLPVKAGASQISTDGGKTWRKLYDIRKE